MAVVTTPLVIAHRGASRDFPENTAAAFAGAREQGADWVELDVRRTADDVLVVHHDPALPDGRDLCHSDSSDLPGSILTLAGALAGCRPLGVNVEIKNSEGEPGHDPSGRLARQTVAEVAAHGAGLDILVSSFDLATLTAVRSAAPALPTALLVYSVAEPDDVIARAAAGGHTAVNPWNPMVDEDVVSRAHAAGLAVNVWTVDDPDRIRQLAAWGVDGIITNCPALAVSTLKP